MNVPAELQYTKEHEWIRLEGNIATIGITDFAQSELGDIVFVEVNTIGEELAEGDVFGTVEAVKTVSDLYMPLAGKVTEVNEALEGEPELVNTDPYDKGWMIKIELAEGADTSSLLSAEAYEQEIG